MKSIVFVVPKLGIGGVERSLISLLKQMPEDRFRVTVLTFLPGGELESQLPSSVTIRRAEGAGRQESIRATMSSFLRKLGFTALFHLAKKLYHKFGSAAVSRSAPGERFDIAVAYADGLATWYTAENIEADTKIAFVHTDVQRAGYDAAREQKVYAGYDKIYLGSQASRKAFLTLLPETEGKTAILPNAIDVAEILRLAEQEDPYPPGDVGCRLLTVGRLSHEKGVEKIPQLLRMLKDAGQNVHWYVVGDGPERENLRQQAQKLGVAESLSLTGALENPYPYIRGCDVYVQPSNYEGYCIALAEARALCVPAVACDFSGAAEQLQSGVDGFVTGMTTDELFPAILELVTDAQKRADFSASLREKQPGMEQNENVQAWWEWL